MLILGIESSAGPCGAALVRDGKCIADFRLNSRKTHSQTLLPLIDEVFRKSDCEKSELPAVAVSSGPGSYTGLRIGSATAKGIGLALGIPIVPVPTLQSLAFGAAPAGMLVCPMMDARRGEVFTALYRNGANADGSPREILPAACLPRKELFAKLRDFREKIVFCGDGVDLYEKEILDESEDFIAAPENLREADAGAAAVLGEILFRAGVSEPADQHVPRYLKKSQAERVREAQAKMRGAEGSAFHGTD